MRCALARLSAPGLLVVTTGVLLGGCGRVGYLLEGNDADGPQVPSGGAGAGGAFGSSGAGGDGSSGAMSAGGLAGVGGASSGTGGGVSAGGAAAASGGGGGGGVSTGGGSPASGGVGVDGGSDSAASAGAGGGAVDGAAPVDGGPGDVGATCTVATHAGHSYVFCAAPLSFALALSACEARGMRLSRIDDDAENTFLAGLAFAATGSLNIPSIWPWFGARAIAVPVQWEFVDGTVFWTGRSNGSPVGGLYSNWAAASPGDATGTTCAVLTRSGALNWIERPCTQAHPYLCETY